jgi:hypothetical protein
MTWLRVLGLRVALACALFTTIVALHLTVAKPSLPFALLDSFDQAFDLAYDAAERKVSELEATPRSRPPATPRCDVFAILRKIEGHVTTMCDSAAAVLDAELATAGALSSERRVAVLGCIERFLDEARTAARRATDPDVRAEYDATCDRLREVRRLI